MNKSVTPFCTFGGAMIIRRAMVLAVSTSLLAISTSAAWAQSINYLPGAVDAGRMNGPVGEDKAVIAPAQPSSPAPQMAESAPSNAPANAASIKFILNDIAFDGMTAYTPQDISTLTTGLVGHEVSLEQIYKLSEELTRLYRRDGYFLSRAFIPAQEIESGKVIIRVFEGYVRKVSLDNPSPLVQKAMDELTAQRPLSVKALEHFHLLLTDLPGMENYQGTLAPFEGKPDAGIELVYRPSGPLPYNTTLQLDNYGSRYLGPLQTTILWSDELIDQQKTTVSLRNSLPIKDVTAFDVQQTIPLTLDSSLAIRLGYTHANPGYSLETFDIVSSSASISIDYTQKLIRQRQENLSVTVGVAGLHSESTILGSDLNTDDVRTLRLRADYQTADSLGGNNRAAVELRQGLGVLGANEENDADATRDGTTPWFSKVEVSLAHFQPLPLGFGVSLSVDGQLASDSLYSSEEFGFGGESFGRAYDSSEITGDHGIAGSVELRYNNLSPLPSTIVQPYGFYDAGKVWNINDGQEATASGSSTGAGFDINHQSGLNARFQVAMPLTRDVSAPLYGMGSKNAQIAFRIGFSSSLP